MKKCFNVFKTMGRKNLILSLMALVLVVVLVTGTTYSWIENITSVQIKVDDSSKSNTSLVTASDLDSTVVISKDTTNAIDLGSYFYESGNMHLSACSGDGELFYFNNLVQSTGDSDDSTSIDSWRLGTADDENTAYLSVTFDVYSPDATTDYWFDSVPTIKTINSEDPVAENVCYSITVDGNTKVYSTYKNNYYKIADVNGKGSITPTTVNNAKNYVHNETDNENYENVLFTVKKGQTKRVNMKFWLQYTGTDVKFADAEVYLNMIIASSWAYTRTIYFEDCTNDKASTSFNWATSNGKEAFFLKIRNEDTYFEMSRLSNDSTDDGYHTLYVEIPAAYNDLEIAFLRCNGQYDSGNEGKEVDGIECWNYWIDDTTLPAGAADATFYAIGSQDNNGTWEEVEQIWLVDAGYLVVSGDTSYDGDIWLHDKSYVSDQIMCKTGDYGMWTTFVRSASTNIDFEVKGSECSYANRTLGYTNDGDVKGSNDIYYIIDGIENSGIAGHWSESKFTASSGYYLLGDSMGGWSIESGIQMYYQDSARADGGAEVYATVDLAEGTHEFKITRAGVDWFTNTGEIVDTTLATSSNGWDMSNDKSLDDCKLTSKGGGTYLFIFNKNTNKLTVHKIPTLPAEGNKRVYVALQASWGNWLSKINQWSAAGKSISSNDASIHWIKDDFSYGSRTYKLFWSDFDEDTDRIQWVSNSGAYVPSTSNGDGYSGLTCTVDTGYLYYLYSSSGNKPNYVSSGVQVAPALQVSAKSITLGESVTLSYTGSLNTGIAGLGSYVAYYVTDEDGNTYNVSSNWLPKEKGTYTVTLRAHDGYILTDESDTITVEVK